MMQHIPILTYHKISNDKEIGLTTVTPGKFRQQMQFLAADGYQSIGFSHLINHYTIPDKPVIITFDDGYENVYSQAYPILAEVNFTGVIFVISDFLEKYNTWESVSFQKKYKHLSGEQVIKLKRAGFEIGSHSRSHHYLPALSDSELDDEITGSKRYLEELTGDPVISFSYPYGRYNDRIIDVLQRAGYAFATANLTPHKAPALNPYSMLRRSIYCTDTLNVFKKKLSGHHAFSSAYLTEFIIQRGALASIGINLIRRRFI